MSENYSIVLKVPKGQIWTIMGAERIPSERQMSHREALEQLKVMRFLPYDSDFREEWYESFY